VTEGRAVTRAFAKDTAVPAAQSRSEIERLLIRYGATSFVSGWSEGVATILFEAEGRRLRFDLPLPSVGDEMFTKSRDRMRACEAEARRRWRALVLVIKAKLEAVESGITTFEEEFLSHIVVPGGKTFGELAIPQIAEAYERGVSMPPLLGGGS